MNRHGEVLIFLHLPKTAGTTIRSILAKNFEPDEIYSVDAHQQQTSFDDFAAWPEEEKRKILLVQGHMNFGFHRLLRAPCTYITMVRHPVDRMISHYYEILRRGSSHRLHHVIAEQNLSVVDYACSRLSNEFNSHQTRMLTNTEKVDYGTIGQEHLELARERLEDYFSVAGVQDRFDEFVVQVQERFGLKTIEYQKENVTPNRPSMHDLSKADYDRILGENLADMELYEWVKARVRQQTSQRALQVGLDPSCQQQAQKAA